MTKQERAALLLAVERLKAMTVPGSSYCNDLLNVGQASYIDTWVLPLLSAVVTNSADRTHANKVYLRYAEESLDQLQRQQRKQKKESDAIPQHVGD